MNPKRIARMCSVI